MSIIYEKVAFVGLGLIAGSMSLAARRAGVVGQSTGFARSAETRQVAEACDEWLQAAGILVRRVAGYALPDCLRITVGDKAGCRRVAHAIGAFKEARS